MNYIILRCIGASIGCFGVMTILPNIMINDCGSLRSYRASLICLSGSLCMVSCGAMALIPYINCLHMIQVGGTGIIFQIIGLLYATE